MDVVFFSFVKMVDVKLYDVKLYVSNYVNFEESPTNYSYFSIINLELFDILLL